jgi:hypothetical protein
MIQFAEWPMLLSRIISGIPYKPSLGLNRQLQIDWDKDEFVHIDHKLEYLPTADGNASPLSSYTVFDMAHIT